MDRSDRLTAFFVPRQHNDSQARSAWNHEVLLDLGRCWHRFKRRNRARRCRHRRSWWRLDRWRRGSWRRRLRIARRKRSTGNLSKRGHPFSSRLSLLPDVWAERSGSRTVSACRRVGVSALSAWAERAYSDAVISGWTLVAFGEGHSGFIAPEVG